MKIQTPLGLEACRARLKESTAADTLRSLFVPSGTILCSFTGDRFRLRQKKSYSNSFEPLFYGRLTPHAGGTEISGDFKMRPFVIAFMAVWFGFLIFTSVMMIGQTLHHPASDHHGHGGNPILIFVGPILMAAMGWGLVAFGQRLGRSQKEGMTRFFEETFSVEAIAAGPKTNPRTAPPIKMTLPIMVFAGLGLMSVVFAIAGIANYSATASNSGGSEEAITYMHDFSARALAFGQGLFLLFMAYGTWKRLYIAWTLGFVLIGLSAVSFITNIAMNPMPPAERPPLAVDIFVGLGGIAVGAYWGTWWYKKKDYFTD